jgi:hypothetical protein
MYGRLLVKPSPTFCHTKTITLKHYNHHYVTPEPLHFNAIIVPLGVGGCVAGTRVGSGNTPVTP